MPASIELERNGVVEWAFYHRVPMIGLGQPCGLMNASGCPVSIVSAICEKDFGLCLWMLSKYLSERMGL